MRMRPILLLGGVALAVTACVPRAEEPPPPQQPQQQPQRPQRLPPPPPMPDWRDLPLTPGAWVYSTQGNTSQALFGRANSEASFIVRCDRTRRQVMLSREGTPSAATMAVRTTNGARTLPVAVQRDPLAYATATIAATDPILDSIAFSRGRFTIETPGLPMLVIPSWPEPARVVEDCRG